MAACISSWRADLWARSERWDDMAGKDSSIRWTDDRRKLDGAVQAVAALSQKQVTVGVHGKNRKGRPDGVDAVRLATIHEYGIEGRIPERSFIRAGLDGGRAEIVAVVRDTIGQVIDGRMTPQIAMEDVGIEMQSQIVQVIQSGDQLQDLAESTKKSRQGKTGKGGTAANAGTFKPLWDTGAMLQSVTFQVGARRGN